MKAPAHRPFLTRANLTIALAVCLAGVAPATVQGQKPDAKPQWVQTPLRDVEDVAASGDTVLFIVQNDGTLSWTQDGGQNLSKFGEQMSRVSANADKGNRKVFAVDLAGHVMVRPQGGKWTETDASGMVDVAVAPGGKAACVSDEDGAVWLSDDGLHFTKLPSSDFLRVSFDPQGTLWATGANGSLWKVNGAAFEKTPARNVKDVAAGPQGTIWLTNQDGTITVSAFGTGFVSVPGSGFENITVSSKSGIAWAAGTNGTVWSMDAKTTVTPPPPPPPITPKPITPKPVTPVQKQEITNVYAHTELKGVEFVFQTKFPSLPTVEVMRGNKVIRTRQVAALGKSHKIPIKGLLDAQDYTYRITAPHTAGGKAFYDGKFHTPHFLGGDTKLDPQ